MILDRDILPLVAAVDARLDAGAASASDSNSNSNSDNDNDNSPINAALVNLQDAVLRSRRLAASVFDASDKPLTAEQFADLQGIAELLSISTPGATAQLLQGASAQYIALIVYRTVARQTLLALPQTRGAQRYYEQLESSAWSRLVYAVQTAPGRAWRGVAQLYRATDGNIAQVRARALHTLRSVRKVRDLQFVGLGGDSATATASVNAAQLAWDAICAPGFLLHAQVRDAAHALAAENDAALARLGAFLREFPEAYARDTHSERAIGAPPQLLPQCRAVLAEYVGVNGVDPALSAIVQSACKFQTARTLNSAHSVPSALVRYWPVVLVALTQGPAAVTSLYAARERIIAFVRDNVCGFARGLVAHWVVGPLRDIWRTVRHDSRSDLALAAAGSLESERESLCRMVVAAVDDSDPELLQQLGGAQVLAEQVREGDLDAFMRLYEAQISAPLRSAISGRLLRSVLVQVQKTKVDGSLALGGIDRLLQSQQLLFAVVALSPALLLAYCVGAAAWRLWRLRTLWSSARECRERARASLAAVERLLNYAEFERADPRLRDIHHALLVLEVSTLAHDGAQLVPAGQWAREWARDVREMLDPAFSNSARLNVVRRVARVYAVWFE